MKEWRREVQTELDAAGTENEKWIAMGKKFRETRYGDSDNRKICLEVIEQELQGGKICAEKRRLPILPRNCWQCWKRISLAGRAFKK